MSMHIERRGAERRQADANPEDDLSPEYLALLEVCGGEIRASDRAVLAERRLAMQLESETSAEKKEEDAARPALPAADRRRAGTT